MSIYIQNADVNSGMLVFFCGKMGAGKSTLSMKIATEINAILLSEDEWLESLYPKTITSLDDYRTYSTRMKPVIKSLVQTVLSKGINVVMDFPANTTSQRQWFTSIFAEIGAPHQMVYIDRPDEICIRQVEQRRLEQPERAATDTLEMFQEVTAYFEEPQESEGITITRM